MRNDFACDGHELSLPCHNTGTAYLLYASDNNQNFKIARLDDNYYNVTSVVSQLNGQYDVHFAA